MNGPAAAPEQGERLGIVVAVREELKAVSQRLTALHLDTVEGRTYYRGQIGERQVVLAKSGIGPARARFVTGRLAELYTPHSLLFAGFCAGLAEGIVPGDLVVSDHVLDATGRSARVQRLPDPNCLERARAASPPGVRIHFGGVLTRRQIARTGAEKHEYASYGPHLLALDMETGSAAEAAEASGLPWIAVRAVTDGLDDDLPLDFDRFTTYDGETSYAHIALALLGHPGTLPALMRLGRRAAVAARNLAAFVETYVRTP